MSFLPLKFVLRVEMYSRRRVSQGNVLPASPATRPSQPQVFSMCLMAGRGKVRRGEQRDSQLDGCHRRRRLVWNSVSHYHEINIFPSSSNGGLESLSRRRRTSTIVLRYELMWNMCVYYEDNYHKYPPNRDTTRKGRIMNVNHSENLVL